MYCLVVTDDYSRFTWVFFLATKDDTSGILKSFITGIENLVDHKVKVIGCANGTEFKNREMNQFCEMKGILRQFSVDRTHQQNGVAERRNMTLLGLLRLWIVEENLHIRFSESTPNGAGTKASDNVGHARKETEPIKHYILIPLWTADPPFSYDPKSSHDDGSKPSSDDGKKVDEDPRKENELDLPNGKRAIGSKWVFRNKKDEMRIMIRNIARLVPQRYTQEEGIDYDEVFAPIAIIEAIRLFLAYASFKDFVVYQMDVKSAFLYGKIEEKVYVCQPPGFEDPYFPDRVYKVEKALYGLHQAHRARYETLSIYLLDNGFPREKIDKTLFIKGHKDDICWRTYILLEITSEVEEGWYLKGQPKLGLWYPKDSPFDLVAYTNSDYARVSLDRKSTIRGETTAQTRFESVSKHSNDSLLARGYILRSDEDRLKLDELMALCINLQNRVLDLEKTNTTQLNEIASLKRRVKKLEKKIRLRTHGLKRLYKIGLTARIESSKDEESLDDYDKEMFDVNVLVGEEVFIVGQNENVVEEVVDVAQVSTVTITTEEITLAQGLEALKTSKPKVKRIVFQEPEPVKPKKKDQIRLDEEATLKLQAEFDEEERLAREKAEKEQEDNIALIETWDDIQAKIDVDHQLAERL
uniref:Copia protein n=1 Tax=Tanacetum cinerariifolium TaxID=118510 RepID=A0A6L2JJ39_TANCI|nr:copia protein [Tanacetum cinerariifolium]